MDPLSISASLVGITTAAVHVSHLLREFVHHAGAASASARGVLREVTGVYLCLQQLQDYLLGKQEVAQSRKSMVLIEQVVIIFTDCVSAFSQLEQTLEGVRTGENMRAIDKLKWAMKEAAVSKIQHRLQASKTSLTLMLSILTCSMTHAEDSMRNLTSLIQEVVRSNTSMSRRLKNLEKMHPALAVSRRSSATNDSSAVEASSRSGSQCARDRFSFQNQLETSPAYQRISANDFRLSSTSSSPSYEPSCLSGLSLRDVTDLAALALPITPTELWNHQRFSSCGTSAAPKNPLETWYNPPARRSAFIRTAYFNGQYTNQYAQSKFTGHLIFRRFTIADPHSSPIFTEGVHFPRQGAKGLGKIDEEPFQCAEFELEDTDVGNKRRAQKDDDGDDNMRLHSALAMSASELDSSDIGDMPDHQPAISEHHGIIRPDQSPPPKKPFPKMSDEIAWPMPPSSSLSARREGRADREASSQKRHYSMLCEEEEAVFPKRKWAQPLADMGNAVRWRTEVLGGLQAIEY